MYTQDNLEEKIKVFEKYPEVELVYSDLSFINKDGNIILESFFAQRNIAFYRNQIIPIHKYILAPAGPICSRSTAVIKKQVAKKYLPIINLIPSKKSYSVSDRDFYFRISTKEKVYGINKPLTHYRRHSANLSANGTSEDLMILLQYYFKK
jgi:hypothetical protein